MSADPVMEAWLAGGSEAVAKLPDSVLRRAAERARDLVDVLDAPHRTTTTGTMLAIVPDGDGMLAPQALAETQIVSAIEKGRRDARADPRWAFRDLDRLVNCMSPGELWVVGASSGNGKTCLMFSQMTAFADAGTPVLYLPLELDADDMRRRWAAWELGLDMEAVAKNQWDLLPAGSRDRHEAEMARQASSLIQIPPDRQITLANLGKWMRWAVAEFGARIVVIDHFHRVDIAGGADYRVRVTRAVRDLKDLAREHRMVVVATAQLNNVSDPLDAFLPPTKQRLKETSALHEEPDVVLMLSRRLATPLGKEELNLIRMGVRSVRDYADPNVMLVTCRKHRLADSRACDRSVRLFVEDGKVRDLAHSWTLGSAARDPR